MTPTKSDPSVQIAQLQMAVQHLSTLVEKQAEALEGTSKTPGMKEKLAIAQYNIESNRQAYQAVMDEVKKVEERIGISLVALNSRLEAQITAGFKSLKDEQAALKQTDQATTTALQKIQPWVNGIAWAVMLAGAALIGALVTGKLRITP